MNTFDLPNENSIPVYGIWVNDLESFDGLMAIVTPIVISVVIPILIPIVLPIVIPIATPIVISILIPSKIDSKWKYAFSDTDFLTAESANCCYQIPGSESLQQLKKLTDKTILIGVCTSFGLIIIASLVGYSFTKRPCSRENVNSISNGANLVTQQESTLRAPVTATTSGMELTNISDVRINVRNCVETNTTYYNALVQNKSRFQPYLMFFYFDFRLLYAGFGSLASTFIKSWPRLTV